jgi:hypothetical protein
LADVAPALAHLKRCRENEVAYTSKMRLKEVTLWALISMILLTILIFSDFVVVLVGYVRAPRELLGLFTAAVHLLESSSVTAFFYTSYRNRR